MSSDHSTADDAYTLIELLVVVVIMGVLVAIAVPIFLGQRRGAFEAQAQADLRTAANQMELSYREHGAYPTAADIVFITSPDVVLTIVEPGAAGSQVFCMTAVHNRIDGGIVVFSWDSDGGGQADGDVC
ncbi:type IV pilin protein [Euzebya pacifica]|uniref:type IV pilin protein n=1 Tax=Euzebya pacifica TaxID=1608957 RepID=UPI000DF77873|nr:prepilin-type N-terminal cleavage/methylation domain-containing protein [Euzebya pacifica]